MQGDVLERLLVLIEGSANGLRQELQKGGVSVDQFARNTDQRLGKVDDSFKKIGTTLRTTLASLGVGFSAAALVNFTRNAINAADAIGETARAAGFGAERFQRLSFVFRQNGVEAQEFDSAMRTANTRLGQFITTGAGPAAKAIEQLGLKQRIANGEIRNNEQLVDAVIEALGKVESGAERAALAAAFFGREAGAKLADTLGRGKQAIDAAAQAATGIMTDETVRKGNELADAWDRIASAAGTWAKSVAVGAAHQAARAAGVEGVTGETPQERITRLRQVLESNEREFPTRAERNPVFRAQLDAMREEIARLEQYETWINTPFIQPGALPRPPGMRADGRPSESLAGLESDISATARRIASAADLREQRRRLGLQEMPALGAFGLGEISVGARQAGSAGEILAARRAQRQAQGLQEFPLNEAAIRRMNEYAEAAEKARERQERLADAISASFESRGIAALTSGKPRDALRGFAKDLAEIVIRLTVLQPLAESLAESLSGIGKGGSSGSSGFVDFLGSILGFAEGGRPPVGRPSLVGEKGPELWVPDVPGRIYSHAQSMRMAAAGGQQINVYNENHIETGIAPTLDAQLTMYGHTIAQKTYDAVMARFGGKR